MRLLAALLLVFACACARKPPVVPPPPKMAGPAFIELEPGWRVQVVTPVLKSGGFILKSSEQTEEGNTITLRTGDEFLGYETAHYLFTAKRRVSLGEVSLNRGGQLTRPSKSIAPRLRVPSRLRFVRLLYTLKVSDADHNMAVLAAADPQRLAALTQRVQGAPAAACRNSRSEYCEWIPAGVAVRPERPDGAAWVPVR